MFSGGTTIKTFMQLHLKCIASPVFIASHISRSHKCYTIRMSLKLSSVSHRNLIANMDRPGIINCFSLSTRWTHPIFRLGYQRRLEASDIYDVTPDDSSVKLSNDLGR